MSIDYPFARNHPTLHAAPTFRPIKRGRRKTGIEKKYKTEKGELIITMFYELDIADQDLMLAIFAIARAQSRGKVIEIDNHSDSDAELISKLELDFTGNEITPVFNLPCLRITTTKYELLKELNRPDNKTSYEWLKASLRRLAHIGFDYDGEIWFGTFHMLSFKGLHTSGDFEIAINPISSHAICADSMGYINIHREERHNLKKDAEKALHSVLCGLVSAGTSRTLYIDKLAKRVYVDYDDEISKNAIEKRRVRLKNAIKNIGQLEAWKVLFFGKGKDLTTKITRRKLPT